MTSHRNSQLDCSVIFDDGTKAWYAEGRSLHREDGPAVEWPSGSKMWYLNGKRHRIDGPAYIACDGHTEWWFIGYFLGESDEGFWALWDRLTDEQRNNTDLLYYLPGAR